MCVAHVGHDGPAALGRDGDSRQSVANPPRPA